MYKVILSSETYGDEEFKYETLEEALAGAKRLKDSAKTWKKIDGVKRKIYLDCEEE